MAKIEDCPCFETFGADAAHLHRFPATRKNAQFLYRSVVRFSERKLQDVKIQYDCGHFERVILPLSTNKKPSEDDVTLSNSEGLTALRLVDRLQRQTNANSKISPYSVTLVLSILPKRIRCQIISQMREQTQF